MTKFVLAAVMQLIMVTAANAEMTIAEYLRGTAKCIRHGQALLWLNGFENGLELANADYESKGMRPMFCRPEKVALTADQMESILDNYLKTATIETDTPISLALLLAMKEAFPCK